MSSLVSVDQVSPARLRKFFAPTSVALVGATDKSRWSTSTFGNLKNFDGPVYLINPRGIDVHGTPSYKSVLDVEGPIDLAYLMLPVPAVMPVLAELAQKGTKNIVLLTVGYGEMGEEGKVREQELLDFCLANDMTLLGPNGNGYINANINNQGLLAADINARGITLATPGRPNSPDYSGNVSSGSLE